jgi:hypothetical protein
MSTDELAARADTAVLTEHNDNARTGANLNETILNTGNVNVGRFGLLFTRPVDGYIYAQPLYVPNLRMPGRGRANVIFVATEHNSVYAYDADNPAVSTPFWQVNLGPSVPSSDLNGGPYGVYQDLTPEIGITGTPVIDRSTNTLYLVAKTKENGLYFQRLHAIDILTGRERKGSPVVIQPTANGHGDGATNGVIQFDALKQLQRAGLLLLNGVVYVAFGGHADFPPYHGWLVAYDSKTLAQVAAFNTSPDGSDAGIWQSGQGICAGDNGDIYFETGNGTFDADQGGPDYGDSFVKLHPSPGALTLLDSFTPYNQADMNAGDKDLGSSGPVYLKDLHIIVGGGKTNFLYFLDPERMGHYNASGDTQILESFAVGGNHIHGAPVYYDGPQGQAIYVWPEVAHLTSYRFAGGKFGPAATKLSTMAAPDGMPGGFLSVSADAAKPGTGIVWASRPFTGDAIHVTVPGILEAFDAADVSVELWNSRQNAQRDDFGNFAKFCPPTIAGGKVYMATFSGKLAVYGLLAKPAR